MCALGCFEECKQKSWTIFKNYSFSVMWIFKKKNIFKLLNYIFLNIWIFLNLNLHIFIGPVRYQLPTPDDVVIYYL